MKIYKLTEKSVQSLYDELNKGTKNTFKRYFSLSGSWNAKGKDNLEVNEEGFYKIDQKLFYHNSQFKGSGYSVTDDFENAKLLYSSLSDLTPSDANDERFWTRLTHEHFHNYTFKRWYENKKTDNQRDMILDRSFFIGRGQRARTHNSVARLWWIPHLTVRHNETDESKKWEITKAIFEYQELITSLLERNFGAYENVRIGFMEFYIENKANINSQKAQKMLTSLNNYGGVTLLPLMSKDEVKEVCIRLLPVEEEGEPVEENA